ncbi:MAG: HEAT repeat domain-containing protein, partial [Planctomycetota bacterium]
MSLRDPEFAPQKIASLVTQLGDPDDKIRLKAIQKLIDRGPEARVAIPKLLDLLDDNSTIIGPYVNVDTISIKAAEGLAAIGPEMVLPVSRRFPGQSMATQHRVILMARQMGFNARGLLPVFLDAFQNTEKNEDTGYRSGLLSAIAAIDASGKVAVPLLVKAVQQDGSESGRHTAVEMLNRSEYLEQVYWRERAPAVTWFREPNLESKPAVDALLAALSDRSEEVRAAAAFSISTYPESAKRALPGLIRLLDDPEFYTVAYSNHAVDGVPVADAAATALSRMHADADEVLLPLVKYVSGSRKMRMDLVADLVVHSKQPVDRLSKLLGGEHPEVALQGLARLGPAARSAIPLVKAVTSPNDLFIVDKVKMTLACIDPQGHPKAVQAVERMLGFSPPETCRFLRAAGPSAAFAVPFLKTRFGEKQIAGKFDSDVIATLKAMGPEASSAAQLVIDSLTENGSYFDGEVEIALVHFGSGAVPPLVTALKDSQKSPSQRLVCLRVLGALKIHDEEAISVIAAHADSAYPVVREASAKALGLIAAQPTQALPVLQRLLVDPRPLVRAAATESCGSFGERAKSLVPALVGQLSDEYLDVRVSAASALGRIGPAA